jgi:hypothetical protein
MSDALGKVLVCSLFKGQLGELVAQRRKFCLRRLRYELLFLLLGLAPVASLK